MLKNIFLDNFDFLRILSSKYDPVKLFSPNVIPNFDLISYTYIYGLLFRTMITSK